MKHLTLAFVVVAALGCKGSTENKPAPAAEPAAAKPVAAPPAAPATPPATPEPAKSEYKPDELWTKVSGLGHMDLLELSNAGVTVTGTVKAIKDDPAGEYEIDLDAGGTHVVALRFGDFGKAAKAKKFKTGDQVGATKCQVTVPKDDLLVAVQCALK